MSVQRDELADTIWREMPFCEGGNANWIADALLENYIIHPRPQLTLEPSLGEDAQMIFDGIVTAYNAASDTKANADNMAFWRAELHRREAGASVVTREQRLNWMLMVAHDQLFRLYPEHRGHVCQGKSWYLAPGLTSTYRILPCSEVGA